MWNTHALAGCARNQEEIIKPEQPQTTETSDILKSSWENTTISLYYALFFVKNIPDTLNNNFRAAQDS